jgi:hypothetical protein
MSRDYNEIRDHAYAFVKEFEGAGYEKGESQTFWGAFFEIFGFEKRFIRTLFEQRLGKLFIDVFWEGQILAEQKSEGRSLEDAYKQAWNYIEKLPANRQPKMIVVSDFRKFQLYSMETMEPPVEFALEELPANIGRFMYLVDGGQADLHRQEDPVNMEAARLMADLHNRLENQYRSNKHDLEMFLVRIMFLFFADDTEIIREKNFLHRYFKEHSSQDGTGLDGTIGTIFRLANMPEDERPDEWRDHHDYRLIPYINGGLFAETIQLPIFDFMARKKFLEASGYDWEKVSPAIFGSMFQAVMSPDIQRSLGAHYTSEKNIMKALGPLFLDDYWKEFRLNFDDPKKLRALIAKIKSTGLFDPACGCGNFLVVGYRELRGLELACHKRIRELSGEKHLSLDVHLDFQPLDVDKMYGIEIEEFPAQVAQTALWVQDHIENRKLSQAFGQHFARIPLKTAPHILNGNALRVDWADFAPPERVKYIVSNPPYVGAMMMDKGQKEDVKPIYQGRVKGYGEIDYVGAWFMKAADYGHGRASAPRIAFVATNSISQGQQVGLLWKYLYEATDFRIGFAHQTFRWDYEQGKSAAVHVVIIGMALQASIKQRRLFTYEDIKGAPVETTVGRINPYLVEGPEVFIPNRSQPISDVPLMRFGSMARDGGHLFLSEDERNELIAETPQAESFVKRFFGPSEFFYDKKRYCLWLVDAPPNLIRSSRIIRDRISKTKENRLASKAEGTRKFADTPHLFCQIAQPKDQSSIFVPRHSSETRDYIPIGFMEPDNIIGDAALMIPGGGVYEFGVVESHMHMTWMRRIGGRLKSDYRYAKDLVYNNFPWPATTDDQKAKVEECAQAVLDARQPYLDKGSTMADLYDPISMPPDLRKAHRELDKAVDRCYREEPFESEEDRLKLLFELYEKAVAG